MTILLSFMFELTPSWFEQYIRDYFDKEYDFNKIVVAWWPNDKGIDIKGERKDNKKVFIQCKKFITSHVTEKDVLLFIEQTKTYKKNYEISYYYFLLQQIELIDKREKEQKKIE